MWPPKFRPGDRVFAKMRGYPAWPARVEGLYDENSNKTKYHIYFYGTKQMAVCKQEDLFSYEENRDVLGKPKKNRGFNEALSQMDSEIKLMSSNKSNDSNSVPANLSESTDSLQALDLGAVGSNESNDTDDDKAERSEVIEPAVLDEYKIEPIKSNSQPLYSDESSGESTDSEKPPSPRNFANESDIVPVLKIEAELLQIVYGIQNSLGLKEADPDKCLELLDDLIELQITPLMLKKHPETVDTLNKLLKYVGNTAKWNMSDEEIEQFFSKAKLIQDKAKIAFEKIRSMFSIPADQDFMDFFSIEHQNFSTCVHEMDSEDFFRMIQDPTENVAANTDENPSEKSVVQGKTS